MSIFLTYPNSMHSLKKSRSNKMTSAKEGVSYIVAMQSVASLVDGLFRLPHRFSVGFRSEPINGRAIPKPSSSSGEALDHCYIER